MCIRLLLEFIAKHVHNKQENLCNFHPFISHINPTCTTDSYPKLFSNCIFIFAAMFKFERHDVVLSPAALIILRTNQRIIG